MEQSKQKTEAVGRDKITQVGNNVSLGIDNRSGNTDKSWINTFWGKVVVGIIIAVLSAVIIAFLKLNS